MSFIAATKTFILRFFICFVFALTFALFFQFAESAERNAPETINVESTMQDLVRQNYRNVTALIQTGFTYEQYEILRREFSNLEDEIDTITKSDWSMLKSFYFTLTIMTTIGYGDITPKTVHGMWLTLVCAFFGIPVMILTLQSLGELNNVLIENILHTIEVTCLKRKKVSGRNGKILMITLLLMALTLIGGAALEKTHTEMTNMEAVYAWFVTISTIGFGDIVVSKPFIQGSESNKPLEATAGVLLLIVFGLGIVASVINAVSEFYEHNKHLKKVLRMCFGISEKQRQKIKRDCNNTNFPVQSISQINETVVYENDSANYPEGIRSIDEV